MDKKKNDRKTLPLILLILSMLVAAAVLVWSVGGFTMPNMIASSAPSISTAPSSVAEVTPPANDYLALQLPEEMRAMWISYWEWHERDISTEEAMRTSAGKMMDECQALGLNTLMMVVRPFGDALYKSSVYPWSHHLTGTQGVDPGYDPLAVLIEEAHARGLRLEAWVNPYRISNAGMPAQLSADNPAIIHPEWVREMPNGSLWYDPGLPEVQQMVIDGIYEIVANYDVDGIHFDDYFYPTTDPTFDADTFTQYGGGKSLEEWRRENVSSLIARLYTAVKEANPTVSFGISPAGNNDNNYGQQYSDVKAWMATEGYMDYVMPQLYWGFDFRLAGGSDRFAFSNICAEWAALPRAEGVRLFAGLAAYHVDDQNDGGANSQAEWASGHILADMVHHLRDTSGFSGFALFRHDSLFGSSPHAGAEIAALKEALA